MASLTLTSPSMLLTRRRATSRRHSDVAWSDLAGIE